MAGIFDDCSDTEVNLGTNNDYAKKYDSWRQKEVLQTLKDRYGDDALHDATDSSTSDDEDDDAKELTEQLEKDFYKTLSYLKKKDPSIYDKDVRFFKKEGDNTGISEEPKSKGKKSDKPLFLRDYERKLIVERSGKLSDDEDERCYPGTSSEHRSMSPTLVEEQEAIKAGFKVALQDSDEEGNTWGGLFESRKKTKEELKIDDKGYLEWLKGQQGELKDKKIENELKHLHDFWNDPKLDPNEQFLKDYVLNRKFLESDDKDRIPTYDEIVHDSDDGLSEDEATVNKQEEFEHKYNFRFEEPDQDFIKRYPRTMEDSLRRKDTRRKEKRDEVKERKVAQKERKKEELKQLKALKRKEIMEKIEKLKQITGNTDIKFQDEDVEGDFDPELHDQRMGQLFTEEFYGVEDNDEKPEFPELDEELELEQWDEWEGQEPSQENGYNELHCDDPNFNMDCDYNPTARFQAEIVESTKKRKKGRKSKLAQALAKNKPVFDPSDSTFEQYVDEYYGMDFEDVVGDLPCRFKYRQVMPNSFGLTIDEILRANDKELNQWCSLKKTVQHRPEYMEKKDYYTYQKKGKNEAFKRKTLTSLYNEPEEQSDEEAKQKKKRKKKSKKMQNDALKNEFVPTDANAGEKSNCSSGHEINTISLKTEESVSSTASMKNPKQQQIVTVGLELPAVDTGKKLSKKRKLTDIGLVGVDAPTLDGNMQAAAKKRKVLDISVKTEESVSSSASKKNPKQQIVAVGLELPAVDAGKKLSKKRKLTDIGLVGVDVPPLDGNMQAAAKKRKVIDLDNKSGITENTGSALVQKTKKKKKKTLKMNKAVGTGVEQGKDVNKKSIETNGKLSRRMKRNKKMGMKKINTSTSTDVPTVSKSTDTTVAKKKKNKQGKRPFNNRSLQEDKSDSSNFTDGRLKAYGLHPKKFKNYLKYGKTDSAA